MPERNARVGTRTGRFKTSADLAIIHGGTDSVRIYNSGQSEFTIKPNGASTPAGERITLPEKCSADVLFNGQVIIVAAAAVEGIYEFVDPQNPIRGGRFKAAGSSTVVIVQDRQNAIYRILNSGRNSFTVSVNNNARATVWPRHSVDVGAGNTAGVDRITITGPARFEGIYDYLHRQNAIRSGRFKIKEGMDPQGNPIDPADPHTIVNLMDTNANAWYRIYNAGENPIIVSNGGTDLPDLAPDNSVDVRVVANTELTVRSHDTEDPIEGSYDFMR